MLGRLACAARPARSALRRLLSGGGAAGALPEPQGRDVVAVVSGGADSCTLLWTLRDRGFRVVEALSFDYGQRHSKELESARRVADAFGGLPHTVVDLGAVGELFNRSALARTEDAPAVPRQRYSVESQKVTVVPNRNMIFLSLAAGRAIAQDAGYIAYAAHASDYAVYPDCRPEFVRELDRALRVGNEWTPVGVQAPFLDYSKAQIVAEGLRLGAPYEATWSCYEGADRPCLECGTCLERTGAFMEAGVPDPALTADEWTRAVAEVERSKSKS